MLFALIILSSLSCRQPETPVTDNVTSETGSITQADTIARPAVVSEITEKNNDSSQPANTINTGNVTVRQLVDYAKTLIGIPYKYGSTDPNVGFDCSGFITNVFNHFKIEVPRSSINFTNIEREIEMDEAKPGDIVLFTGTDHTIRHVGHMGIITENSGGELKFIHSTSGKANGVTISPLNSQYKERFVKVIRVFKENDKQ